MTIPTWRSKVKYAPGTVVIHNGAVYQKSDDNDNSEPDNIGGGWELRPNDNAAEYEAIVTAFSGYETRKAAHKLKVAQMIQDAGLTPGEVLVTLEAGEAAGEVTR